MAPEAANLIPKASIGGIASITTLIARKLEPQRTDNVTSTSITFNCFDNKTELTAIDYYKSLSRP
jgi:hypothetical protein